MTKGKWNGTNVIDSKCTTCKCPGGDRIVDWHSLDERLGLIYPFHVARKQLLGIQHAMAHSILHLIYGGFLKREADARRHGEQSGIVAYVVEIWEEVRIRRYCH